MKNKIILSGNISSVKEETLTENNIKSKWFDICSNEIYIKNNEKNEIKSFYSCRIFETQLKKYNDLLKVGAWIEVEGRLKTYIKDNKKETYILVYKITDLKKEKNNGPDWLYKEIESVPATEEEIKEMEELLSQYM